MSNGISPFTIPSLVNYLLLGQKVGGFLTAFLENDLRAAVNKADNDNRRCIPKMVCALAGLQRDDCWGSPEKVKKWIEQGGLKGREDLTEEEEDTLRKVYTAHFEQV